MKFAKALLSLIERIRRMESYSQGHSVFTLSNVCSCTALEKPLDILKLVIWRNYMYSQNTLAIHNTFNIRVPEGVSKTDSKILNRSHSLELPVPMGKYHPPVSLQTLPLSVFMCHLYKPCIDFLFSCWVSKQVMTRNS